METIERPGYLGKRKQEKYEEWDKKFGKGNWDLIWKWGEITLNFEEACRIYEDAYYNDSFKREGIWNVIFTVASDIYDNSETNVNSGSDYTIQEEPSTHLQDIAVRRVGIRRGWKFKGNRLVQIRGRRSEGYELMPGIVPFHLPYLIEHPNIAPNWADTKSVESFYQNNRWLAIKK